MLLLLHLRPLKCFSQISVSVHNPINNTEITEKTEPTLARTFHLHLMFESQAFGYFLYCRWYVPLNCNKSVNELGFLRSTIRHFLVTAIVPKTFLSFFLRVTLFWLDNARPLYLEPETRWIFCFHEISDLVFVS